MHTDAFLKMKAEKTAEWGNRPCEHLHIVEEWYRGSRTGAYACAVCGRDVTAEGYGAIARAFQGEGNDSGLPSEK